MQSVEQIRARQLNGYIVDCPQVSQSKSQIRRGAQSQVPFTDPSVFGKSPQLLRRRTHRAREPVRKPLILPEQILAAARIRNRPFQDLARYLYPR